MYNLICVYRLWDSRNIKVVTGRIIKFDESKGLDISNNVFIEKSLIDKQECNEQT